MLHDKYIVFIKHFKSSSDTRDFVGAGDHFTGFTDEGAPEVGMIRFIVNVLARAGTDWPITVRVLPYLGVQKPGINHHSSG